MLIVLVFYYLLLEKIIINVNVKDPSKNIFESFVIQKGKY